MTEPLTDEQHTAIRQQILTALSEAGACCGECGFEPGETGCPDCVRVRELYADALTPIIGQRPACPDPIECGHEAALGQLQEQHRRDLLAADASAAILQQQIDAQAHELDRLRAERDELATELGARDEKARKRWIKKQEQQLGIKYADFRAGRWEMDLAMGREMAAAYVAMAKTLLGDAPNYTETKLEFDVKIAESPEVYTLVVQRHAPGALTPHEARQRAEAQRDGLAAVIATVRETCTTVSADRVELWDQYKAGELGMADAILHLLNKSAQPAT